MNHNCPLCNTPTVLSAEHELDYLCTSLVGAATLYERHKNKSDGKAIEVYIKRIKSREATIRIEVERAYGGCHNCYGKGYSTELHAEIAYADFGDEFDGDKYRKTKGLRINFCSCDRGKQLEKLVPILHHQRKETNP